MVVTFKKTKYEKLSRMSAGKDLLTELKIEFRNISETLISIKSDIKELNHTQNSNNSELKMLALDLTNTQTNLRRSEQELKSARTEIDDIKNKQNWLLAKVGGVTTAVTGIITWLLR